jgi:GNAT superfamily N-acetyltransferase
MRSLPSVSAEMRLPAAGQECPAYRIFEIAAFIPAAYKCGVFCSIFVSFAIDCENMIHQCKTEEFEKIYEVINDAASVYKGIIPPDCWKEPYMSKEELQNEIQEGVVFWGYYKEDKLLGVMGIQPVQDVTLIRHSYVRSTKQNQGIGGKLLSRLRKETSLPILIGTWAAAVWAIRFYEKHGFKLISREEKDQILTRYWSIPERQISNSVVLADEKWFKQKRVNPHSL